MNRTGGDATARRNRFTLAALAVVLWAGLPFASPAFAQHAHSHKDHSFADTAKWASQFDDPARDAWQKPHEVLEALALTPRMAVVDIGSGTGYFTMRIARHVPAGTVTGVDAEPQMVLHLRQRAAKEGLKNVVTRQGKPDTAGLAPKSADLVLLVDTYHHIDRRVAYFTRLREALRPGGRLAVIDFRPDAPNGPPPAERIGVAQVKAELAEAGFRQSKEFDFLPNQFFLMFEAAPGKIGQK